MNETAVRPEGPGGSQDMQVGMPVQKLPGGLRMTAIREEVITIQRETVDEGDLARALAVFDPVWESLSPREQSRIVRLLVERVGYDGRDGRVTVTFRSPGVKALCSEADIRSREVSA